MQNRYFKFLMYLGVWLGLNILWGLRSAILYSGVSFPTMFMGDDGLVICANYRSYHFIADDVV